MIQERLRFSGLLVLALPAAAYAQVNAIDGAVEGYVRDATGSAVKAAQVTLTNIATGAARQAVSDGSGYYRFPLAPVGQYQITIAAPGFKSYTQPASGSPPASFTVKNSLQPSWHDDF